ncbi:MAG: hypothetical protein WBC04_23825 [Candidatus Acidiferrales bacterium]
MDWHDAERARLEAAKKEREKERFAHVLAALLALAVMGTAGVVFSGEVPWTSLLAAGVVTYAIVFGTVCRW